MLRIEFSCQEITFKINIYTEHQGVFSVLHHLNTLLFQRQKQWLGQQQSTVHHSRISLELPNDINFDVLCRLPVNHLVRATSSIVENIERIQFIQAMRNNSNKKPKQLLVPTEAHVRSYGFYCDKTLERFRQLPSPDDDVVASKYGPGPRLMKGGIGCQKVWYA